MSERGRNRLVGGLILLSLAVVLLPMLFDGAGIERREIAELPRRSPDSDGMQAGQMEAATAAESWAFTDDVQARRETEAIRGQPRHLPDGEQGEEEVVAELIGEPIGQPVGEPIGEPKSERLPGVDAEAGRPALDAQGLPRAWSVQLAAFRDRDNARALRQRLLDDGYDAYVIEEGSGPDAVHRVAVGPRIDRDAAQRLRGELAQRYDLEGLLVRFTVGAGSAEPADG